MSSLERTIYNILRAEQIPFEQEKRFEDLKHGYYRFDFYLPSHQVAIECQGAQHYEFCKKFHKKRSDFTKAQERDRIKISWCLAHNIKLYCIPYWDISKITSFDDITNEVYLAHSKFHNDEAFRAQKRR